MQISSSAYMGVEALVRLAAQNTDKPCSIRGLAEWINRSMADTEILLAQLHRAGLIAPRQGPGGGYILARPADRITVAEVFEAVDAPSDFANRPLNADTLEDEEIGDLHGTDLLWEALKSYVLLFLNGVSLADLAPQAANLVNDSANDSANDSDLLYRADMDSIVTH